MSLFKKSIACVLLLCAQGVLVAQEQINHNTVIVEQAISKENSANDAQEDQEKQSFYKARRRKKKKQWGMGKAALVSGGLGGVFGFAVPFTFYFISALVFRFGGPNWIFAC